MKNLIIAIILTLGVIAGGFFLYQKGKTDSQVTTNVTEVATNVTEPASDAVDTVDDIAEPVVGESTPIDLFAYPAEAADVSPYDHAMSERYIGSLDAPVVFDDYSSLTCPHCADFHTNVLPLIKKNFIDNGLVRMTFKPMPLNEAAIMGDQMARCLPKADYYKTISLLYENQRVWAFSQNPRSTLANLIKLSGVSQETIDTCLDNQEIQQGLAQAAMDGAKTHDIKATPTLVFENGTRKEQGVKSYDHYAQLLNNLIEAAKK